MKVLVTGAAGFVGALLAERLLADADALGRPLEQLLLADIRFAGNAADPRVRHFEGSIADAGFIDRLAAEKPDLVFHLASIPGGAAERDQALGAAVNLHAAVGLLERLASADAPPVVVFTSTVAVYGAPLPALVDAATPLRPVTSYGAHKLMTEILLADMSRRGVLDGRCVRLPGIVARPPQANGHVSAFMSNIFHALRAGERFVCPVSPHASCWWMSAQRCVDNLLHAARIPAAALHGRARVWALPVLRLRIEEVVDRLAARYGADRLELVAYAPIEQVEAVFARQPPIDASEALALGFSDDGSADALVRRALNEAAALENT